MEFHIRETDVESLARNLTTGLAAHATVFPDPPVPPTALTPMLAQLDTIKQTLSNAEGAYDAAMTSKAQLMASLTEALKTDIRYAENLTGYDNDKLVLIGWGGRKEPTRQQPPGSPRDLLAEAQEGGGVNLSWRRRSRTPAAPSGPTGSTGGKRLPGLLPTGRRLGSPWNLRSNCRPSPSAPLSNTASFPPTSPAPACRVIRWRWYFKK